MIMEPQVAAVSETSKQIQEQDIFGALRACSRSRNLEKGKSLHAAVIQSGDISNIHVASSLVDMYAKCRRILEARRVFDEMKHRDVVAWTALILGYANDGKEQVALQLFARMGSENCAPNALTYVAVLKACTHLAEKEKWKRIHGKLRKVASRRRGMAVHAHAVFNSFSSDMFVASALVDLYAKCGSIADAQRTFDSIRRPDVVCWNALIFGYVDNGEGELALSLFASMKCEPTALTTVAALKACTLLGKQAIFQGLCVHSGAVLRKFESDVRVASTLIDMYAKSGFLVDASRVFQGMENHTVVAWTALMFGYAENGDAEMALKLFSQMGLEGCPPNALTSVAALKACSVLAAREGRELDGGRVKVRSLEKGMAVHFHAAYSGLAWDVRVASTLVDMYSVCGSMPDAALVFEGIRHCNVVVSWNAMLFGYVENGEGAMAMKLFSRMQQEACEPDVLTYVAALKACGMVGALDFGRRIHADIVSRRLQHETILVSTLVDFYGTCGSMAEACEVFDSSAKCLISWTALMTGYSRNGDPASVFTLFERMRHLRLQLDGVVFRCVLTACSHAGLVEKGRAYFDSMPEFGLRPGIEHYHCMIDILGRANHLEEAVALLKRMPFAANAITWTTLLGACRKWKNLEVGRMAFDALVQIDSKDAVAYLLMGSIYQERSMWREQSKLEAVVKALRSSAREEP